MTVAKLSNGMTVIVKPTRTAPVVAVRGYVRAGGLYEREWLGCGLSHLLEHLLAEDASHAEASEADEAGKKATDRVRRIGGQANAYTALDRTCYHISAAAGKTDDCIALIADWMARPAFSAEDFRREHGVVQREIEKSKDEPERLADKAHMRNVFGTHPAGVPVIGYAEPLSKVTLADVSAYYKRVYVPQNVAFCVVGDVEVDKVLARTLEAFAGFERGRVPDLSVPEVRPFAGVSRAARAYKDLEQTIESVSFQSIALLDEDLYALDVLAQILGHGQSSRLYREILRNRGLVTSISCHSWTPAWGKGVFTIRFRSTPEKADAAEGAILAELEKVVETGVTKAELTRAKRQVIAAYVKSQQTAESIAAVLASDYLATGNALFSKHYTDRIQAVTPEQVHAAAEKYFTFDKMAITRLPPKLESAAAAEAASKKRQLRVFTLDNGLRVILQPTDVGLVSMAYVVKGGLLAETEKTNGLGTIMTALSTRGTRNYTAKQIDEFFDKAGGWIIGGCGNNSFYWQALALDDSFDGALEIFADVVTRPTFPQEELDILRPTLLARIEAYDEHWYGQLNKFFREKFFTGPYSMLPAGREEVVENTTVEQVRRYHESRVLKHAELVALTPAPKRSFINRPGVLAVFGNFDPERLPKRLEGLFGELGRRDQAAEAPPSRTSGSSHAPKATHVLKTDKKQAAIMIGAPGTTITDIKDRLSINVLDTIISGYDLPSGWLHNELRGKQLVYVVHSYNWAGLATGAFVTYAACQPERAKEVVEIIKENLRRAADYKPTQDEIDEAVNSILTAEVLGRQDIVAMTMDAAINELYGLGYDFHKRLEKLYRQVTPEEVQRVGRKYLGDGYVVTVTTPKPELLE
ncbi:MAG: M16 family metallopeptidase [Planctomycetota bacterium]